MLIWNGHCTGFRSILCPQDQQTIIMFTIVLLEPQIPPNTGSTGRLCGATNTRLHIVGILGFELSDKTLKRAGLDYWDHIDWNYFPDSEKYCKN